MHELEKKQIGFKVLSGHGASIDTTPPAGKLVFGIFAALAEFERELITERTRAGLAAARARGRSGGAPYKMTVAKLRLAMAAMGQTETKVGELCRELVSYLNLVLTLLMTLCYVRRQLALTPHYIFVISK